MRPNLVSLQVFVSTQQPPGGVAWDNGPQKNWSLSPGIGWMGPEPVPFGIGGIQKIDGFKHRFGNESGRLEFTP